MRQTGKWIPQLTAPTTVAEAARLVINDRLRPLPRLLKRAASSHPRSDDDGARKVHQLRVATRRASVAVAAFADVLPRRQARRTLRVLREIRRAAGGVRDRDVLIDRLTKLAGTLRGPAATAARRAAADLRRERADAWPAIRDLAGKTARRMERRTRRLAARIDASAVAEATAASLARRLLRRRLDRLRQAGGMDLHQAENLHEVRLAVKRLRYAMELFGSCFDDVFRRACYARLLDLQDRLGAFNDLATLDAVLAARREEQPAREVPRGRNKAAGIAALRETIGRQLGAAHADALAAWAAFDVDAFMSRFEESIRPEFSLPGRIEPKPRPRRRAAPAELNGHAARSKPGQPERIAAIDVGTNSLRLIIAEVTASGAYRVLDDEKEVTRLGRGLHESGCLDPDAIAHSVAAIARMQSIAAGYGVSRLKVVATAAAREAANPGDLVRAVAEQTGLEVEIITAEQEAMLAYRSASRAFDLRSVCAVVLDVGGGSTEVVLSAPRPEATVGAPSAGSLPLAGRPIIERIYTIPLGAVRLTERFGGPEAACGRNFRDMRRFVKSVVRQHIGRPPAIPQIVIGTGGTLTTLGAVSIHRELKAADSSLFAAVVQGHDVPRADLRHMIDYLRKLPLKERARVPGLSSDRADIIVPGLVIVDAVLRRFDANRVRIHEGGIRDGLLLSMLGPPAAPAASPESGALVEDPIAAVRRFARACAYEEPHSLHVAGLARQIFDQLRPMLPPTRADGQPWFAGDAGRARQLLEAAAILHDVGYLINYAAHHKHSYHLILHADLPGWSAREIQVIAQVARYHRCGQPKRKHRAFAMLERADRRLVRELAGILRIADGFDRTHTQLIGDVRLRREGADVVLEVTAAHEPSVDLWGAARKSGLFERAFRLRPRFEWCDTERPPIGLSQERSLISV